MTNVTRQLKIQYASQQKNSTHGLIFLSKGSYSHVKRRECPIPFRACQTNILNPKKWSFGSDGVPCQSVFKQYFNVSLNFDSIYPSERFHQGERFLNKKIHRFESLGELQALEWKIASEFDAFVIYAGENHLPSLKLTVCPWNWAIPKGKFIFQPSIFRVWVSGRVNLQQPFFCCWTLSRRWWSLWRDL